MKKELEKLSKDTLNLGFTKLDYRSAKEKEMKLGLDLKGGINVLLEINQRDLVNDLTNYSTNPVLVEALNRTDAAQRNSTKTYIDNFFVQFEAVIHIRIVDEPLPTHCGTRLFKINTHHHFELILITFSERNQSLAIFQCSFRIMNRARANND